MMTNHGKRITQGQFSYLPDLTDAQITKQIEYALDTKGIHQCPLSAHRRSQIRSQGTDACYPELRDIPAEQQHH